MNKHNVFFFTLVLCMTMLSCNQESAVLSTANNCKDGVEKFKGFFQEFHQDSLFQIERTIFPLKGVYIGADYNPTKTKKNYYWKKKDWIFQSEKLINNKAYKTEMQESDTLVIHKLFIENSGLSIERYFSLIDCKWYLSYYSDISL